MDHHIDIVFTPAASVRISRSVYQYDHGLQLRIGNIAAAGMFQVHYAVQGAMEADVVLPQLSGDFWVSDIPDHILSQPHDIDAYIHFFDEQSGQTMMHVVIPVTPRVKPSDHIASAEDVTYLTQLADAICQTKADVDQTAASIDGLTASAENLQYSSAPFASVSVVDGHKHLSFGIPKGKPNIIKSQAFPSLEALMAGVPSPEEGDQYNVGSPDALPYRVYRYTGDPNGVWEDQGYNLGGMTLEERQKFLTIEENANHYVHPEYLPASKGLYSFAVDSSGHVCQAEPAANAASDASGLMSADDKRKLDSIDENANDYTHPEHTEYESGLYKFAVDNEGHVVLAQPATKGDLPLQNATTSNSGLMSTADKTKLNGVETGATFAPRPNLLDNWYFANPVNQRGKTEYTAAGYTVDRWYNCSNGLRIGVENNGLNISVVNNNARFFSQRLETPSSILGRKVTLSMVIQGLSGIDSSQIFVRLYDANSVSATSSANITSILNATVKSTVEGTVLFSGTATLPATISKGGINVTVQLASTAQVGASFTLNGVKLELGNGQTLVRQEDGKLVMCELPNYGQELAKCQRYLQPMMGWCKLREASRTTSLITYMLFLSVPMRSPNPSLSGDTLTVRQYSDSAPPQNKTFTFTYSGYNNQLTITATPAQGMINIPDTYLVNAQAANAWLNCEL